MLVEIVMPKLGESIQEGTVLRWLKKVGEVVAKDEILLEISTDKVDSEIPSPASGLLKEILVNEHQTVPVGTVLAYIESAEQVHIQSVTSTHSQEHQENQRHTLTVEKSEVRLQKTRWFSPVVRSIAKANNISEAELNAIIGTGFMGRVTKRDIESYLQLRTHFNQTPQQQSFRLIPVPIEEVQKQYPPPQHTVVPMDGVQLAMAEHMNRSVATSPHATMVDEADMSRVLLLRSKYREHFDQEHHLPLSLTPFIVYCCIKALAEYPLLNSQIVGTSIVFRTYVHVGLATATEYGLVVPVVRSAESKNFLGLAKAIYDLTIRAKEKKLLPDELRGSTFSITNYGVFGSILGTPILSQPNVAILGIGTIKKRPVVVTDQKGERIEIRSMANITITFDHRVVDGATGGKFLSKLKSLLEQFDETELLK